VVCSDSELIPELLDGEGRPARAVEAERTPALEPTLLDLRRLLGCEVLVAPAGRIAALAAAIVKFGATTKRRTAVTARHVARGLMGVAHSPSQGSVALSLVLLSS
jgi:hypothetical protein